MARLPQPGQDNGIWGDILNDFLQVAHAADGSVKPIAQSQVVGLTNSLSSKYVKPSTGIPETDLDAAVQTKLNAPAAEPADGSITSTKIADGTITNVDVSATAAIAKSKLGPLAIIDSDVNALSISKITNLQTTLDDKIALAEKGAANGVATLGADSRVPSAQLGSGTASTSSFLRGDGSWQTPPAATITAADITDSTELGRNVLTATDEAAARGAIGAGTSNLVIGVTSTTAKAGDYTPTKAEVGLENVDNTSDAAKPISSATQAGLDTKQDDLGYTPENIANKGQIDGYASLDGSGKVPSGQLPAYPDDALAAHLAGAETFTGLKTFPDIILAGSANPTYAEGKLAYDTTNQSLNFYNGNSGVSLQVGQEQWIRVINNTAAIITNGTPVYITGAASNFPAVAPALATTLAASMVIGITTETIAIGATGFVTISGLVRNINTSAFAAGATLYVSSAAAGALVSTAPAVPNFTARVGTVLISNATTGVILVSPNPPRLFTQQTATIDLGVVLSNLGYRAAGTAYPITTSGTATLSGAAALTGNVRYGVLTTATTTLTLTAASVKYQFLNAASNGITVTLPATTTAGIEFEFIRIDATANIVTINGTINGVSGYALTTQYQGVKIVTTTVSGTFYAEPFGTQVATPINRLASVAGISGTTTGVTPLYTVPAGRTAIITSAHVRCTAANTISTGPMLGIGVAAGEDDIYATTSLAALLTAGQLYGFSTSGISVSAVAGSVIKVGIDTAATGTSQTLTVDLVGYLV